MIDKIYNYLIAYYETQRNPKVVMNFFSKAHSQDWINQAVARAEQVHPDLLQKYDGLPEQPVIAS